ncbi:thiamine-phosphate kinase [Helicobacter sp. 11S03491-1]|uniref:thiamine-phosphate kinase n=1 Tax=Helicobacter sp. 11S03491-1 TaxID=1476196 RepID=UPI000BA6865F|nr:thiamine-phosphate kinase [Helicobacter sp. 11S03491-1]PAF42682.1 hypothetical protein BKH45_04010 [Helicobacter sp. 11S03491-1]
MDKESYFIRRLIQSNITKGIGDDGVVFCNKKSILFPSEEFCLFNDISMPVYAMDMFWEGVHFKRGWFSPSEVAQKAFLVNISDILAMNAVPKYVILGISLPKDISNFFIDELVLGIQKICKKFKIKIIGGDTIGGSQLGFAISMIGEGCPKILFRKKAQIGDLIVHTGKIGESYQELIKLLRGGRGNKKSRFFYPLLRGEFIKKIAGFAHLGIDISDGIATELNRLSKINKLHFKLYCPRKRIYQSGEEYEMLFCIAPKDYIKTKILAQKCRLNLECIGEVVRGMSAYQTHEWHG